MLKKIIGILFIFLMSTLFFSCEDITSPESGYSQNKVETPQETAATRGDYEEWPLKL
ncbi:MAG: hypothetical protein JXA95_03225 [Spirochaetales bacterium]|nr:hypothetical protein [Spirochaetales bacterium]